MGEFRFCERTIKDEEGEEVSVFPIDLTKEFLEIDDFISANYKNDNRLIATPYLIVDSLQEYEHSDPSKEIIFVFNDSGYILTAWIN